MRNTLADLQQGRLPFDELPKMADGGTPIQARPVNWDAELAACNRMYATFLQRNYRPYHEVLPQYPALTGELKQPFRSRHHAGL